MATVTEQLDARAAMYESASHGGCIPCAYAGAIGDLLDDLLDDATDDLVLYWWREPDGTYHICAKIDEAPHIDQDEYYWEIRVQCSAE